MEMPLKRIEKVLVLGGGSAGLIAALTIKKVCPSLAVEVVHSVELGIIGVGEGTTAAFPRHFFEYLKMSPADFYADAQPTWKLGIHFVWGPNPTGYYYSFQNEYKSKWPELSRNTGFYCDEDTRWVGQVSACMARDKVFPRRQDGGPHFHKGHAFHLENRRLVAYLDNQCRKLGVTFVEGKVESVETGPEGVKALILADGRRMTGDLFVDASGFRSELLGRALGEEFISYGKSLYCDRAVVAGWLRTNEVIKPYTVAETMNAGWCWQIDHEDWINRGYVYSSRFLSDEDALAEFRAKNPKLETEPRVVHFRSGRHRRNWAKNVVGIGNSMGFVEPLEATALQVICAESSTLADTLKDSLFEPPPSLVDMYNKYNTEQWDDIRDFLSVHYRFNRRLDTPFWKACRAEIELAGAEPIVRFYQENGPSLLSDSVLFNPSNSFGMEGYLAMLIGQGVPHAKPYNPSKTEAAFWREKTDMFGKIASSGFTVGECLAMIRSGKVKLA